ncbi:ABC transporter permease [Cognatishimia activa]|uniref:Ribose transport system permease protein RbsC n=1 Tax=Cognatishimia activa TaxID=1715691 RepID=A0A0P1IPS9_9RHOB|nr:ABC transporter permease [Cognatishimia activa]CUI85759.1 Ribose transport system permease protein RbsC [Cognatishimia activa]CUK25563.1 Ribose transport system permease protein RbsC [Cognatishimia activa]
MTTLVKPSQLPAWVNIESLLPYIGTILLIVGASFTFPQVLSIDYLSQQLQIAAFLGILAAGATLVILLGHIDLSVPWTLNGAAIVATAMAGSGNEILIACAIPAALLFGAVVGAINGLGVTILRIPSMVWTLAMNSILLGISVLNTGGFNPKGESSATMSWLASGTVASIPVAFLVWMTISTALALLMMRTGYGRYLRSIGFNERAVYLSGVSTKTVVTGAFMIAGVCSAFAGVMLAGYANQAYQSMGDPFLLPTIAAVVIGGTSILGGRGGLFGSIGGALFITILNSILSVMQISDAWRSIVFGVIILAMLLFQTLRKRG